MGILTGLFKRVKRKQSQNISPPVVNQSPTPLSPVINQSSSSSQPDPNAQLMQLEARMNQEMIQSQPLQLKTLPKPRQNWTGKLFWPAILIGIPVGAVYIVNLPYPVIRRPVAKVAPILLLPSQINIDSNFKQSMSLFQQAEQLIERPTSAADIDLGQQKLKEAKESLNAIPLNSGDEWSGYNYGWYNWQFSWGGFQQLRGRVGQLEAKVFQEKNSQALFVDAELALNTAKTQYQKAATPTDKRVAIASWQLAIDKLEEIPAVTLAGRSAQQKLVNYQREFKQEVGLAAGNEKVTTLIVSAQQFSRQAAQTGQNPPHKSEKWQEIEKLWQMAIDDLSQIPSQDLEGYAKARKLMAEYSANLGEIRVRRKAEEDSVNSFESAQNSIERLLASTPTDAKSLERNRTISQLQNIINDLDKVQNGTLPLLGSTNPTNYMICCWFQHHSN